MMSQSHNILVNRTHRPFKLASALLSFIRGSPNDVHYQALPGITSTQASGSNTSNSRTKKDTIPEVQETVRMRMWIRSPLSFLPVNHVERFDIGTSTLILVQGVEVFPKHYHSSFRPFDANPVVASTAPDILFDITILHCCLDICSAMIKDMEYSNDDCNPRQI